jgi:hypothetical protein
LLPPVTWRVPVTFVAVLAALALTGATRGTAISWSSSLHVTFMLANNLDTTARIFTA